ncbi:PAS domain S-box-containing protein [Loktanella fryxellensis]|uniref:histidine kinase n=1 Tax=Loktanella fryxellensis TaxID=245187 RepID=A0A1H8ECK2_9RHOB|nr:CHASE domain-containing protein [Loktanella fryxellensis]SEN17156.1 PAS domain S-box-containing protein [Loktanella fryxellensis]
MVQFLSRPIIRILFAALCLGLTFAIAAYARHVDLNRSRSAFQSVVTDSGSALSVRIQSYVQSLDALAALMQSAEVVTEAEWETYVDTLQIQQSLPGVLGLGLILPTDSAGLDRLRAQARAAGEADLIVRPETDRIEKFIIRYIAPIATNAAARGLDIAFEDNRRMAALTSRDTGTVRLTGPINLVQGDRDEPGGLILRPIYSTGSVPSDTASRRDTHVGWVYMPFFTAQALSELTASQSDLFDVSVMDAGQLLYSSAAAQAGSDFTVTESMDVLGRTWTMTWVSTPRFDALNRSPLPWLIVFGGLSATLVALRSITSFANRETEIDALVAAKTEALSDRVKQNRSVIKNSVFGVILLDATGRVVDANPAAAAILRLPRDDVLGRPFDAFLTMDEADDTVADLRHATLGTGPQQRRIEVQRNLWHRSDGSPRQSVLLRDVTAETQSRQALSDMEERWSLALQGAEIGVFDVDLTTNTPVVSATWRNLLAVPDDPDLDMQSHFMSRVHPEDLPVLRASDRAALRGDSPRSTSEFRVLFPGNEWRWMRSDAVVVARDADGRALRMIGAQTDITALRQAQMALSNSEDMLRLVIARAPVGTAILGHDGTVMQSNDALMLMTGLTAQALHGQHIDALVLADDRDAVRTAIADLYGHPGATYRGEHRIMHKDGTLRWGLIRVSWVFDAGKEAELYIVQINDVTQEKQAEQIKNEFIATISHELRTPLTSIKGALGLLMTIKDGVPAPSARLLDIAANNTDRLIRLVNDILDLEKISAGQMKFQIDAHDASRLIADALEQNQPLLLRNGLSFVLEDGAAGAQVWADDNRLAQVFGNLLSNACKYAPAGSAIAVALTADADVVRFAVTDTGPGVPIAFRDRIFSPFSQADGSDTRQRGGTGLGLNISRQMVEHMGGSIGFDSEPGVRTTFHFTLPRVAADAGAGADGSQRTRQI